VTNSNLVERSANLAEILPSAQAAGTQLSAAFTFQNGRHVMALVNVGTPGSGGIVNAQFVSSATSGGSYVPVTGTQIVPLAAAGIARIEMRADRVNALGFGPYFKLQVVVTVATVPTAANVTSVDGRYEPNSQFNDATVASPDVVL
jgi:hypothetical protein